MAGIADLIGKHIFNVERIGDEELHFHCLSGERYRMVYHQDCCASCSIEDICGDLDDLLGYVLDAREEHSDNFDPTRDAESQTWTFYIIQTNKGAVTIRWYGSSNGYYSETASFELVNDPQRTWRRT